MDLTMLIARFLGAYLMSSLIFYPAYIIKKFRSDEGEEVSFNTLGSIALTLIFFVLSF